MINLIAVEDNLDLLDDMMLNLKHAGMNVVGVNNGQEMDETLKASTCDILLLDLGLPGEGGMEIAKRLKQSHPQIGIIMVTAEAALSHKILGHKLGADHYLTKPVNYLELIVVIESLYARLNQQEETHLDEWLLDISKTQIQFGDQEAINLTWIEVQILKAFANHPELTVSKAELVQAIEENEDTYDPRRLETAISRIRKKLSTTNEDACPPPFIKALRNHGYQFLYPIRIKNQI